MHDIDDKCATLLNGTLITHIISTLLIKQRTIQSCRQSKPSIPYNNHITTHAEPHLPLILVSEGLPDVGVCVNGLGLKGGDSSRRGLPAGKNISACEDVVG
jgi:hypothetical protein